MKKKSLKDLVEEKQSNLSEEDKKAVKTINQKTKQYKNLSKEQLIGEIIKKKKSSNSINNNSLNEFEEYISPMLDAKQKKQLNEIMGHLKK